MCACVTCCHYTQSAKQPKTPPAALVAPATPGAGAGVTAAAEVADAAEVATAAVKASSVACLLGTAAAAAHDKPLPAALIPQLTRRPPGGG